MATSRRNPNAHASGPAPDREQEPAARRTGPLTDQDQGPEARSNPEARGDERLRMPPVRLAPREELAAAARVAPLLRAARDVTRWALAAGAAGEQQPGPTQGELSARHIAAAVAELEIAPDEVRTAWQVATALDAVESGADPGTGKFAPLSSGNAEEVLGLWDGALRAVLAAEDLDGLATALYTVGAPVRMESLFDAYAAAAGTQRFKDGLPDASITPAGDYLASDYDEATGLSRALETLADLGVVELGTEESAGGLTVALSPLGIWGVHRRLRAQGWHVPVLGGAGRPGAAGLLATLASCDAEDGEAEIGTWLAARTPALAAAELVSAARAGSPGLRGAAFAVLDRVGAAACDEVRAALTDPLLRAHAAVWLHEHGEQAELTAEDRTWLLVDLGAGLLEEADPRDVVAELLPEVPARTQAEIVASLWQVSHPGVTDLLTALGEHHPDPAVARAARKASFKARSPSAGTGRVTP